MGMKNKNNKREKKMKYIIKLNNKIISRRDTKRTYNFCWVRVVQKEKTTLFYKNNGETITILDYFDGNKVIVLNGQKVNQMTSENKKEKDSVSWSDYKDHIDESKSFTTLLDENYTFNQCTYNQPKKNWEQKNLLFSGTNKFSDPVNGVRLVEFNYSNIDFCGKKKVA